MRWIVKIARLNQFWQKSQNYESHYDKMLKLWDKKVNEDQIMTFKLSHTD